MHHPTASFRSSVSNSDDTDRSLHSTRMEDMDSPDESGCAAVARQQQPTLNNHQEHSSLTTTTNPASTIHRVSSFPKILQVPTSSTHESVDKDQDDDESDADGPYPQQQQQHQQQQSMSLSSPPKSSPSKMSGRRRKRSSSDLKHKSDASSDVDSLVSDDENANTSYENYCCSLEIFQNMLCISSSAILGAALRIFVSRLFGEDCEKGKEAVQDVFTPWFSQVCITAGGKTDQTGGALFRDFPANILGCFVMGLLSSHRQHSCLFPWWHKDHPLQHSSVLHTGLTVGFCGCLTTFASWNTQMVVMMDGTYTELGPTVATSLFGYIIGIIGAISSFTFGREVSFWMHCRIHNGPVDEDTSDQHDEHALDIESNDEEYPDHKFHSNYHEKTGEHHVPCASRTKRCASAFFVFYALFLLLILALFLVGVYVYDIMFYRDALLVTLMAPLGALSRWKLSSWNGVDHPRIRPRYAPWLPWGTLAANMSGVMVSIICQGLLDHYGGSSSILNEQPIRTCMLAIKVGFAGSLSTVSSLAKEIATMQDRYPGDAKPFIYASTTCLGGMAMGLALYSTIVRIHHG